MSQAGQADRVEGGPLHTRGVWSSHGAVLLGQGVSRAAVFGQQYGHSRGSLSLLCKALSHRDLFLRPEKSRFPYSSVTYVRCTSPVTSINSRVFSLYMGCLL